VAVALQPDYWLSADAIRATTDGQITLGVDKDHLTDYKVEAPSSAS
jgi:hypothetical protein